MTPETIYNAGRIPLAPTKKRAKYDKTAWWFACPSCDDGVDYKQKRCRLCGQRIDWENIVADEEENPNDTMRSNWIV